MQLVETQVFIEPLFGDGLGSDEIEPEQLIGKLRMPYIALTGR